MSGGLSRSMDAAGTSVTSENIGACAPHVPVDRPKQSGGALGVHRGVLIRPGASAACHGTNNGRGLKKNIFIILP